jgi:hypothetical protein
VYKVLVCPTFGTLKLSMKKIVAVIVLTALLLNASSAQKKNFRLALIGFYNLENLFDTIHTAGKNDYDFTPTGLYKYNTTIYFSKLDHLADAISQIGIDKSPDGLAMYGVAEIECATVLHDLALTEKLKSRNYRYVHYESPDTRGIDVGLVYNPKYFKVISSAPFFVQLPLNGKDSYFTRDVLYVKGVFGGDTVHVFVNHWPSRVGGEERSISSRAAAAQVCKTRIDSIMAINPASKIIAMGDLNDDPISPSVTVTLKAKAKVEDVQLTDIYNPWISLYKKGIGTLAYQDSWGLFDQIMISGAWLDKTQKGFFFQNATIFNADFLIQKTGKFKNYPKRTWDGSTYNYGYSDHFPVYITLYKRVDEISKTN